MDEQEVPSPTVRRVGRPPAACREEVARIARTLFLQDAFAATPLDAIAAAAGVSRRSLGNYFPTKADMVWDVYDRITAEVQAELHSTPIAKPVAEAVLAAIARLGDLSSDAARELRQTWILVERNPELEMTATRRIHDHGTVLAAFVAERTGLDPADLLPQLIGAAGAAITATTSRHWALAESPDDLATMLDVALRPMLDAYELRLVEPR